MDKVTLLLARKALALDLATINSKTLEKAKKLVQDGTGVMLAGMNHPTICLLANHVKTYGSSPQCPVYGHGFSTSPHEAAFINGSAIHVLDYEPMFVPPTHAVSPILAGLYALAHQDTRGETEKRFMCAFIAGIQFQADLRNAARSSDDEANKNNHHFPFEKHGFHPPGTVGALGSALAASVFLSNTVEETAMALGIAASRSSGLAGNIGTMTKATHCGHASRVGLESAFLAKSGVTASVSTLESPSGWGEVFGGDHFNTDIILEGISTLSCFEFPGFAFKKWPAHTAMQIAIQAAIPLHKNNYIPESIQITSPVFKYCNRPFPKDTDDARFSFQCNVALGILDGEINFHSYSNDSLNRESLQSILSRIELNMVPGVPSTFDTMEIGIKLDDGRRSSTDRWPGHWKSRAEQEDHDRKFLSCATQLYPSTKAQELLDQLKTMEDEASFRSLLAGLENAPSISPL